MGEGPERGRRARARRGGGAGGSAWLERARLALDGVPAHCLPAGSPEASQMRHPLEERDWKPGPLAGASLALGEGSRVGDLQPINRPA